MQLIFSWNEETVKNIFEQNNFSCLYKSAFILEKRKISVPETERWFNAENSSYGKFIKDKLGKEKFEKLKELFIQAAEKNIFNWKTKNTIFIISAKQKK